MTATGYARVSTDEQDLTVQLEQLKAAGCDRIYQEKASGVKQDRPKLIALLDYVREGDTVTVCKLDRIARSTKHLLEIVEARNPCYQLNEIHPALLKAVVVKTEGKITFFAGVLHRHPGFCPSSRPCTPGPATRTSKFWARRTPGSASVRRRARRDRIRV